MNKLLAIALSLFACMAQAQTVYQLFPPTPCQNQVCAADGGIPTDPVGLPVDYFYDSRTKVAANPLSYGISIGGVMFLGIGGGIAQDASGRQVALDTTWTTRRTCPRSGRGQHCSTFYSFVAGSVTLYFVP
jgi:hypothetical protein